MSWEPRARPTAPQQTRPRAPRSAHITLLAIILIGVLLVSSVAVGIALWVSGDSDNASDTNTTQPVATDNTQKSPATLYAEMVAAVSDAQSFRRTGTISLVEGENPETVLQVGKNGNSQATIKLGGGEGEIIVLKEGEGDSASFTVYAKGRTLWAELFADEPRAPEYLGDDWYEIPNEGDYKPLHEGFVSLAGPDGAKAHFRFAQGAAKGQETEVDGTPAVLLSSQERGSKVYLPSEGTPYPIRIEVEQDDVSFSFDYSDFGDDITITAPEGARPFEEGLQPPAP